MTETRKKHRRVPEAWKIILGNPVERTIALSKIDELFGTRKRQDEMKEYVEREAFTEQFEKMRRLKEHFGIEGETGWRPWYELAVAVISESHDGLQIVDPPPAPTHKTAPRWRGAEGLQLLHEVEILREERGSVSNLSLLAEMKNLAPHRYGDMDVEKLERGYYEAKKHHQPDSRNTAKQTR